MIKTLDKKGYRKPFIITGHRKAKSGLYKFKGGRKGKRKLLMLQRFDARGKAQPQRFKWLTISRKEATSPNKMRRMWADVMTRVLR